MITLVSSLLGLGPTLMHRTVDETTHINLSETELSSCLVSYVTLKRQVSIIKVLLLCRLLSSLQGLLYFLLFSLVSFYRINYFDTISFAIIQPFAFSSTVPKNWTFSKHLVFLQTKFKKSCLLNICIENTMNYSYFFLT